MSQWVVHTFCRVSLHPRNISRKPNSWPRNHPCWRGKHSSWQLGWDWCRQTVEYWRGSGGYVPKIWWVSWPHIETTRCAFSYRMSLDISVNQLPCFRVNRNDSRAVHNSISDDCLRIEAPVRLGCLIGMSCRSWNRHLIERNEILARTARVVVLLHHNKKKASFCERRQGFMSHFFTLPK